MEASELTAWVVTLLTQASNGAAGAIGGAAGAEASRLVRDRLQASPEGRAALGPENGAAGETERQVTAVLDADPDLARRLEHLRELAQRQPSVAPYAGRNINQAHIGDRARNNTIAFGPLTLRKDQLTPTTVTALLMAVALVLGLAVYGLVQAAGGGDRAASREGASAGVIGGAYGDGSDVPLTGGEAGAEDGGGEAGAEDGGGGEAAPVRDLELAKAILPDLQSMPAGWSLAEEAETQEVTSDNCSGDCGGLLSEGDVTYAVSDGSDRADIKVEAYETVDAAVKGYEERVGNVGSGDDVASMSLEQIGDESTAFSQQEYTGSAYTYAMATVVRAGTVVIRVSYGGGYDELDSAVLSGIARAVAERAAQAQNGDQPSAAFAEAP
ncbi:hypothetical protein ACIQ6Y_20785 [Streptomyces sp. NPDC096205]|uniref:hypothetical protein n=1 Tax=Streptomyces sp. NPDC096205 TaxID=3366081 RepID=UPI00382A016B